MAGGENWTDLENDVIVGTYLDMLERELRSEAYVKARFNESVQMATGRTKGSVEFKFQNVSAVLIELSHPYVRGYRPAVNFQDSLRDAVLRRLPSRSDVREAALQAFTQDPAPRIDFVWDMTEAPKVEFSPHREYLRRAVKVDYVQVDAANRSLGMAGELAVVDLERERLKRAGRDDLAEDVIHASRDEGDGLGYDVRSFSQDGEVKFIEVKTTRRGPQWPMLISSNEVRFSKSESERFSLYRVYDFDLPKRGLYVLDGDIERTCVLRPAVFEALPA